MSDNAIETTTTHDDGRFVRTGIGEGSYSIVDGYGKRLAVLNIFAYPNGNLIVDVCDTDHQYDQVRGLTFTDGKRNIIDGKTVVSADFRNAEPAAENASAA